ncbi:helix-turn-helix domain-containing protein [Vagococcus salmoninarum]|uniref:helix-turn-helix domain-containing protein n=1 Tax=Vagococcus salmoninarum TaxID=2739 RepID=UPI0028D5C1B4|nr:helix-turn-helix domain-containing protein [Vagococcus salmoninarum]
MDKLLEKRELRDLQILSLLYSEERWWSTEEIAQHLNTSIDSANKSVNILIALANNFEGDFQIVNQKNKGVILHVASNYTIAKIESIYYQNTTSYQIINELFQNPDLTLDKLINDLFISKSTLYRKLKSIDFILEKNNLSLDKNTFKIIGSEMNIREFYYTFYWAIRPDTWPFRMVKRDVFEHRLDTLIRETELELSSVEKMQMYYRMAINFIQQQKKQFITEDVANVVVDPYRLFFLKDIGQSLVANVPAPYQQQEFYYLALIFSTYPYMGADPEAESLLPIVNWYREQQTLSYRISEHWINSLAQHYPNQKIKDTLTDPKFMFMLLSVTNYSLLFPKLFIHSELTASWRNQAAVFKKATPGFYQHVKEIAQSIEEMPQFKKSLMSTSYSIYAIYSIFQQFFDLYAFENTLTIKVVSAADAISEVTLSETLKNRMSQNLIISLSNDREDQNQVYDLLLSDVAFPENQGPKSKETYIWDFPPSNRDWQNVTDLLDRMIIEKKQ